jgi:hypothetical protein
LEVAFDVRCSRIHLLKEATIKIFQALRVQIGINTNGAARCTYNEIQRQPISVNLGNDDSGRFATRTSGSFKLIYPGLQPGFDLSY